MARGRSSRTIELIRASYAILRATQPNSVRGVAYRLFTDYKLIPSMEKKHTNAVSRVLTIARDADIIPWEWVVDETRELEIPATWADPADYAETVVDGYRRDHWALQARYLEVWSEKGTVRGILAPILKKYGVGFRVHHGHTSTTVAHDAAEDSRALGKPTLVIYVGDYDPSGMDMSVRDLPRRLAKYRGRITLVRLALVADDIADPDLPWFPAADKIKDQRYAWYVRTYGDRCWEVDALDPNVLRERVERYICANIDLEVWERCKRTQEIERESLTTIIYGWRDSLAGANRG